MFLGGQERPISILGEMEEWKNAQKIEINKKISDTMNKIIPIFKVEDTFLECSPSSDDSVKISFLQEKKIIKEIAKNKNTI